MKYILSSMLLFVSSLSASSIADYWQKQREHAFNSCESNSSIKRQQPAEQIPVVWPQQAYPESTPPHTVLIPIGSCDPQKHFFINSETGEMYVYEPIMLVHTGAQQPSAVLPLDCATGNFYHSDGNHIQMMLPNQTPPTQPIISRSYDPNPSAQTKVIQSTGTTFPAGQQPDWNPFSPNCIELPTRPEGEIPVAKTIQP